MQAFVRTKYGSPEVIQLIDTDRPEPRKNEVLVEIHAVSLNAYDWHFLTADVLPIRLMGGFLKPNDPRIGSDMAGRVTEVGSEVKRFKPGDEVFGTVKGACAEYACAPENSLALKPANASFEEAAALPMAAITALQGLRNEGHIQAGQKVLINGASGGVGTFAIQIAKVFDTEVTAVCSTRNLEQSRSLAADHVIDYSCEDFTKNGKRYDLIFAVNGYHPITAYKRSLSPKGIYVTAGGSMAQAIQCTLFGPLMSEKDGRKFTGLFTKGSRDDLETIRELFEAGRIRAVIDKRFPFTESIEAFRYIGEGHARGKVVVSI